MSKINDYIFFRQERPKIIQKNYSLGQQLKTIINNFLYIASFDTPSGYKHRKICTGETGDIGDIVSFANIVMQFFCSNHVLHDILFLVVANSHSIFLRYVKGFLVQKPL